MFESLKKERRPPKFLFFEKEKKINNNKKKPNLTNHNSRYSLLPQLYEQELGDSQEYLNDRRTTNITNQLREDKVIQSKLGSTKLKHTWDLFSNTNTKSQNNKNSNMIKSYRMNNNTNLTTSSLLSKFNNLSFKNSQFKTTNSNSFSNSLTFQKKEANKNYKFNSVGNEKNINQKELSKKFSFNNKEKIENQYQFSTETKQRMKTYHNNNSNNNVNLNNVNQKQFQTKYNNQKINSSQRNNYKQNYYNNNSNNNNSNNSINSIRNDGNNHNYYYNENEVNRFNPPRNNNQIYSMNNQNLYYNHQIKQQNNPKLINNFSKDLKFERELDQQKFVRPYHFGSWWMAKPDLPNNNSLQQQEQQFNNNRNNYNYSNNINHQNHHNNSKYINNNKYNNKYNDNNNQKNEHQTKKNERKEHPLGEYPNRALFVRNIDSNIEDEQLFNIFIQFGEIKEIYSKSKIRGFVLIKYYDIRHSMAALEKLQGKIINGRKVDIHYSIPKENPKEEDQNQGTVVCFNLDETITNEHIFHYFSEVGQVKEIRSTPNKLRHRFIEYYDIRDANRAIQILNKSIIKNREIKVELSRAGGIRSKLISNYRKMKNTCPKNKKTNYIKTRNNIDSNSNNNNNSNINNSNINININKNAEYKTSNQIKNQYISNNFDNFNKNQEKVTLINQNNYNSYNNQNTPKTFNNKYKKYNNNKYNNNNMNMNMNMNKQNAQSSTQPKLLFKIDKNDQNKYYSEDSMNDDHYNYTKQTSFEKSFHVSQTAKNFQVNQN
ncbi:protein mei2-like 4 [Anaeramoeba flamelloides]|uniref:Protein mei2-like 4 n=1 Tax=Anaeramoeba flamelloides TaxID=1746091 RepID=A0ABQ8Y3K3_9EUKA|nr:protein mei2-like 4 [Anaeramoeba flamelloides]